MSDIFVAMHTDLELSRVHVNAEKLLTHSNVGCVYAKATCRHQRIRRGPPSDGVPAEYPHNFAEEPRYGLAVKKELETYYQDEVNHGRLYPNLDDLVSEGLVDKSALDKRTNLYELTTEGQQTVFNRIEWILSKYATSDSRASDVSDLITV